MRKTTMRFPVPRNIKETDNLTQRKEKWEANLRRLERVHTHYIKTANLRFLSLGEYYNIKAVYIDRETYDTWEKNLHPSDFEKYMPRVDDTLKLGEIYVDDTIFVLEEKELGY